MLREVSVMVCVLVAVVHALPSGRAPYRLRFDPYEYDATWEEFKRDFNRSYEGQEETYRRSVFVDNAQMIERHNWRYYNKETSFYLGINQFADLTVEEFRKMYNLRQLSNSSISRSSSSSSSSSSSNRPAHNATRHAGDTDPSPYRCGSKVFHPPPKDLGPVPERRNWYEEGGVTDVKNQGVCGSCWAFSSTGAVEGMHFHATGKLISLSEQQLMSCSIPWGNFGCNGGMPDKAFEYLKYWTGQESEKAYPYTANSAYCQYYKHQVVARVSGCTWVHPRGCEAALKAACGTQGPMAVGIDASDPRLPYYQGGIYDYPDCSSAQGDLDHGVLVAGYDSQDGQDYWLVKNSWGSTWGMSGYIKMSRNKNNQCGIATEPIYPLPG